jgi:hypothetical protein
MAWDVKAGLKRPPLVEAWSEIEGLPFNRF